MATFSSVTRNHLLQAIAEHDSRGAEDFLALYDFQPLPGYAIVHEGSRYDLRGVVGVAHRIATGRLATAEEFASSMDAVVTILRRRGFEVVEPSAAARAASRSPRAARTPRTTTPRATRQEAPAAICPTCSMALPATGVCDDCG
ncbi:MAG: hypothetical protein H5T83_12500 [Actinotalea sp.]|nr:hypothetical protein [Actinotalea sp.]